MRTAMASCISGSTCCGSGLQGSSFLQMEKPYNIACFWVVGFPYCGNYISLKAKRLRFCIRAKVVMLDQARRLHGGGGETVKRCCLYKGDTFSYGFIDKSLCLSYRKEIKKKQRKEHHLWKPKDSARSGQKAFNLVRMLSGLSNEKEVVYGALNKWVAWETEFPVIAAAKALQILRKRTQWGRVIQVAKWMLSKGQGTTMATYDTLLLAFDMDKRVDEAESLWNMILHTHTRSIPKRLFSRIIALYAHHDLQDKVIEVFADMEELGVRPDEDTTWRVAYAFRELGEEDKRKVVLRRYLSEFKYAYFNNERVKVKRHFSEED